MKKLISVLLVLLMLATPLYVFAAEEDEAVHQGSYEEYFENFNLARAKNATPGEDVIKPPMATKPYSSALLSAIINAMKSGKSNVSIESYKVKTSEINDVMAAVYSAYPLEYTAARLDYYGWSYYTSSNVITKINLYYYSDKLTYAKRYAALKAVVDEITGSIPTGATEFEKVLAVHDWLVYNCQYDLTYSIYDGYTILTSKTGVCQAYSEAYKLLMDVLGVECVIATSRQMNHAWNMVRIGGSWYHVDATWDDPVPDTPGQIYYSYFLHSDSDFINSYEHHDWVTDNNIVCSNREYEDLPRGTNSTQHYKNGYWYYIKDGSVWRCDYNGNNPVNLGISANSIAFYGDFMIYSNGQKIYEYNLRTGATTLLYTMQSDECGALPYYAEVSSLNVSNDGILTYKCLAYYPVEGESYYRGRYEPGKNSIILKTSGGAYDTKRLYGNSRVNTSIAVAKYGWTSGSNTAILTNGYNFADALAGGPLAYALDAPIILTANKSVLETEVLDQLQSAGVRKVIILGGTAAVNSNIETQIAAKGYQVERVYGTSRYETAVKIAQKLNEVKGTTARNFFVAAGNNYPDALSVSPAAAISGTPILFAKPDGTFDQSTIDYIARTRATSACILGGTAAVGSNAEATLEILSVPNVSRLYGASRYDTSLAICNAYRSLFTGNGTIIATGTSFPDALAGGAFGAKKGIPVVLVNPRARIANVANYLSGRTGTIYILGGTGAVSDKCVADYIR